jgi:hypothetical protein
MRLLGGDQAAQNRAHESFVRFFLSAFFFFDALEASTVAWGAGTG